jgi:hypothetical protein
MGLSEHIVLYLRVVVYNEFPVNISIEWVEKPPCVDTPIHYLSYLLAVYYLFIYICILKKTQINAHLGDFLFFLQRSVCVPLLAFFTLCVLKPTLYKFKWVCWVQGALKSKRGRMNKNPRNTTSRY